MTGLFSEFGIPATINRVGSMFTVFMTARPVTNYLTAKQSDTKCYASFFHAMLEEGVYLAPSQFEAAFLSIAHGEAEISFALGAARRALERISAAVKG